MRKTQDGKRSKEKGSFRKTMPTWDKKLLIVKSFRLEFPLSFLYNFVKLWNFDNKARKSTWSVFPSHLSFSLFLSYLFSECFVDVWCKLQQLLSFGRLLRWKNRMGKKEKEGEIAACDADQRSFFHDTRAV